MDRRSTGSTRTAKGIYADQSWDRWLEKYCMINTIQNQNVRLYGNQLR